MCSSALKRQVSERSLKQTRECGDVADDKAASKLARLHYLSAGVAGEERRDQLDTRLQR